jgi:DNA-binding LytR/AlgR family response regulator
MIRAIALDDEPPALRVLSHFCQQVDFVDLQKTFTRTDEAQQYLTQSPVDLLFLDINMPYISGIDFYKTIGMSSGPATMVIFTTAYAEYAVEGFTLNAVDYLLKPFTFERFRQAVTKAHEFLRWQQRQNPAEETYIYVRADYTLYKIALNDILFIEGLDDYLKIHLQSSPRPIVARMTMKSMLEKLPGVDSLGESTAPPPVRLSDRPGIETSNSRFVRVHRSYIVPFNRIEGMRGKNLLIAGHEIPIGASYEADFLSRFR